MVHTGVRIARVLLLHTTQEMEQTITNPIREYDAILVPVNADLGYFTTA